MWRFPMAPPGLWPGAYSKQKSTFPLAALWVWGELRMLRLTWVTRQDAAYEPSL